MTACRKMPGIGANLDINRKIVSMYYDKISDCFSISIEDGKIVRSVDISMEEATSHGIVDLGPLLRENISYELILDRSGFVREGNYWNRLNGGKLVECFFRDGSVLVFIHGDGGRDEVVVYNSEELKKLIDDIWK